MKRIAASLVALAIVGAVAVSFAAGSASAKKQSVVHLQFWSWVPKINLPVALWNKTHPDIQVKLDVIPGGSQGGYAKMQAAEKAGNAPDDTQIEYGYLPTFVSAGDIVNIGKYVSQATVKAYAPSIWSQVASGKNVYAIPQDFAPMGFYYDKAVFTKDGITSPPKTWAQFAADAATIHKDNPNQYIANFPTNESDWLAGLAWQNGAKWFSESNGKWKVTINDAATEKVASFWQGLINSGDVEATPFWSTAWDDQFQTQDLVGWFAGAWGDVSLSSAAPADTGDWAIAAMPQWKAGEDNTGDWGGSTTAVMKGTKYPQQAAEFAAWLNTNAGSMNLLANDSGLYMASSNWYKTSSYKAKSAYYNNEQVYTPLAKQKFPAGWEWGPTMEDTFTDMNNVTADLTSGKTIADALATGESQTISTMRSQGYKVSN